MSRAFVKEDAGNQGAPRRDYRLPPRGHPDFDAAAAAALLEAARAGETASAEQATGYYSIGGSPNCDRTWSAFSRGRAPRATSGSKSSPGGS
ncbi:MAG: hypothetical protein AUH07_09465 [Gemmatimonadetes bacterium 13_2_20CM_70_9]|nr:MAG: hypothetical protein AUH07_09465 [Gemmatimonadetes bacterium 13_2_20CM_70_9]